MKRIYVNDAKERQSVVLATTFCGAHFHDGASNECVFENNNSIERFAG